VRINRNLGHGAKRRDPTLVRSIRPCSALGSIPCSVLELTPYWALERYRCSVLEGSTSYLHPAPGQHPCSAPVSPPRCSVLVSCSVLVCCS
jgi:hypothetical protein